MWRMWKEKKKIFIMNFKILMFFCFVFSQIQIHECQGENDANVSIIKTKKWLTYQQSFCSFDLTFEKIHIKIVTLSEHVYSYCNVSVYWFQNLMLLIFSCSRIQHDGYHSLFLFVINTVVMTIWYSYSMGLFTFSSLRKFVTTILVGLPLPNSTFP